MSRRRKFTAVPHARLEVEQIYDLVFLMFGAWSPREISTWLNLPIQTVGRNIKRIREVLFSSTDFVTLFADYLWVDLEEGRKLPLPAMRSMYSAVHTNEGKVEAFSRALYGCFFECPVSPSPAQVTAHFQIDNLYGLFRLIHAKSMDDFQRHKARTNAKAYCKVCPIDAFDATAREQAAYTETKRNWTIDDDGAIYAYLNFFISRYRVRSRDDFLATYESALVYALWASRFAVQSQALAHVGLDLSQIAARFFNDYCAFCAQLMAVLGYHGEFPLRFPSNSSIENGQDGKAG